MLMLLEPGPLLHTGTDILYCKLLRHTPHHLRVSRNLFPAFFVHWIEFETLNA